MLPAAGRWRTTLRRRGLFCFFDDGGDAWLRLPSSPCRGVTSSRPRAALGRHYRRCVRCPSWLARRREPRSLLRAREDRRRLHEVDGRRLREAGGEREGEDPSEEGSSTSSSSSRSPRSPKGGHMTSPQTIPTPAPSGPPLTLEEEILSQAGLLDLLGEDGEDLQGAEKSAALDVAREELGELPGRVGKIDFTGHQVWN